MQFLTDEVQDAEGANQNNYSGRTRISFLIGSLSESLCKLLNRVVPNGTLRGVEGEDKVSPIRFTCEYVAGFPSILQY